MVEVTRYVRVGTSADTPIILNANNRLSRETVRRKRDCILFVSCMSQDEHDRHGDREPKSKPKVGRSSEGTLTGRGMTRENRKGGFRRGGGDKYVRVNRFRADLYIVSSKYVIVCLMDKGAEDGLRATRPFIKTLVYI